MSCFLFDGYLMKGIRPVHGYPVYLDHTVARLTADSTLSEVKEMGCVPRGAKPNIYVNWMINLS